MADRKNDLSFDHLSGQTNGKPIVITATAVGSAQTIHTATSDANEVDFLEIFANNVDNATSYDITITVGGLTAAEIASGPIGLGTGRGPRVVAKLAVDGGEVVRAYADTTTKVQIYGTRWRGTTS